MKRRNLGIIGAIALFAISGCRGQTTSFQADAFLEKDKCIVSIEANKTLCYGDSRAAVEAVVGGDGDNGKPIAGYDSGVRVAYRGDAAVGFLLGEGSEGVYRTARGARVGMSKDEVMNLYGRQYAYEATPYNLDYAYDTKAGQFVDKTKANSNEIQLERERIFLISALFDGNKGGAASQIDLIDQKMAIFFE
ncbi:hypothetical protein GXP70_03960 [Paenibacillus lycopersici]|uniref:Lipoprotein n=1 Tax=Paenibacillus lycopersici TaxID=2704462 RepID=A0A6C0G393_9BACL|nr:hypothetical protein [Paenibacillus lycopersici]QHT59205.1 hypothetical protein GXP70_03960 [Paenibacillus lycopersici]